MIRAFIFIKTIDINGFIGKGQFYIIKVNIHFLFYLVNINRFYIKYNNLKDIIITHTKKVLVVRQFGNLFLLKSFFLWFCLVKSFNTNLYYLIDIKL